MAREVKEYTCIVCPMGCPLKVELEDGCYEFTVEPVKAGVQVERLEFVPAAG